MSAKGFVRDDVLFSLCGLNCSLCPMFVRGGCTVVAREAGARASARWRPAA